MLLAGLCVLVSSQAQEAVLRLGECTLSNAEGDQAITTNCPITDRTSSGGSTMMARLALLEATTLTSVVNGVAPGVASIGSACPAGSQPLALKDEAVATMLPMLLRYKGALPGEIFLLNAFAGPDDGAAGAAAGQYRLGYLDSGVWRAGPASVQTLAWTGNANIPACAGHDPYAVRYDSPSNFTLASVNGDTSGVLLCSGETELVAKLLCSIGEDVTMMAPSPPALPPSPPPPTWSLVTGVRPGIASLRGACPSGSRPFALKSAASETALPAALASLGASAGEIFLVNAFAGPTGGSASNQYQVGYIASDAWAACSGCSSSTSPWTGNANIPACRWDQYAIRYDSPTSFTLVSANGDTSGVLTCETEWAGTRPLLCTSSLDPNSASM